MEIAVGSQLQGCAVQNGMAQFSRDRAQAQRAVSSLKSRRRELCLTCIYRSINANPPGSWADYTLPVLRFADGSYVMDSANIVQKLESAYPEPSLRLDAELGKQTQGAMGAYAYPLMPVFMPRLRRDVQREDSSDWIKADRERRFGMPEEQLEKEKGGEEAWRKAEPAGKKFEAFMKEQKKDDGPFLQGSKVCYADFMIAAFCEMFKCIGNDVYEKLVGPVDGLRELHEACYPWFKRNDY